MSILDQIEDLKKTQVRNSHCYEKRIRSLRQSGRDISIIKDGIRDVLGVLDNGCKSFVVYGEPQSGKTEFMIALTCKLIDLGLKTIFVIMNDNTELETQNFNRFSSCKELNPSPLTSDEVINTDINQLKAEEPRIIFCRKNSARLRKLLEATRFMKDRVVIDDEADYASPDRNINKINKDATAINDLVDQLINGAGGDGVYIGVTATPARLDLNNTFFNNSEQWVFLGSPNIYKGRNFFFPFTAEERKSSNYKLVKLPDGGDDPKTLRSATFRFLARASLLNLTRGEDKAYSMLIHTGGTVSEHEQDQKNVEKILSILKSTRKTKVKERYYNELEKVTTQILGQHPTDGITVIDILVHISTYIGQSNSLILNSKNDKTNVDRATNPTVRFTFAIGGNLVSRGLTFKNLLSFYFARDVKHKLQQNTYIQRARMFGYREYSEFFELAVPEKLFSDWANCFSDHEFSLKMAQAGTPFHLETGRTAVTDSASKDKQHVRVNRGGEWLVGEIFDLTDEIENILVERDDLNVLDKIHMLKEKGLILEEHFPNVALNYIDEKTHNVDADACLVLMDGNRIQNIESYKDGEAETISRKRSGIIDAIINKRKMYRGKLHYILPIRNKNDQARFIYRNILGDTIWHNAIRS